MGRVSSDHQVVIHSSIALLRERFRQLRREKEMRQRRELLRTLWESERYNNINMSTTTTISHYEPSKLFFFQTEILKPPPPCQVSQSLWPNAQIEHSNFQGTEKQQVMKLWDSAIGKPLVRDPPINFNDSYSDVDTSLHL